MISVRVGGWVDFHFLVMEILVASRMWRATVRELTGIVSVERLRRASSGVGGIWVFVIVDIRWNISVHREAMGGQSQRMCLREPICPQFLQQVSWDPFLNFADREGVMYHLSGILI